jgi:WD40 repeat protein
METPIPVGSFALNPYGSMLAYTNSDSTELHGMFLGPKQDQILAQDISDPVALAFAHSGRFVAVGSKSGTVHVVDIATRQAAHVLRPTDFDISPVQHLCAGPDGTWIVVYKDNWLARWSADGELMDSRKLPSTAVCIAVAAKGGQVAYGSRAGYIRVRSADFSDLLFKEHVHLKQIRKIIMAEQGDMLMALDTASSVRWVNL